MYIKIRSVGTLKARKRTLIRKNYILDKIKKYEEEKQILISETQDWLKCSNTPRKI